MKLEFLNRDKEITRIKRTINSTDAAFIVVYGRRRCEKSLTLAI